MKQPVVKMHAQHCAYISRVSLHEMMKEIGTDEENSGYVVF